MFYPKFLSEGDIIEVPSPSGGSDKEADKNRIMSAKSKLEDLNYKVKLSKNIFQNIVGRSADAKTRADELNEFFESDSKMIFCAEGGDFLLEILPYIDFDKIVNNPKWIEGFSDPTGILFPITTKYDIATIYGTNFKSFGMKDYHKSLINNLEILKGSIVKQESYDLYENEWQEKVTGLEGYNLTSKVEWKSLDDKECTVKGRIIAGCLDVIEKLAGTKYDGMRQFNEKYKDDGIILGFDNCELSKEELIRTFWKLNALEYFKYAKCVIIGRNGLDKSCYVEYSNMEKCLQDSVLSKLNIPIIFDADLSHKAPSLNIINGAVATVNYKSGKGEISFELK